MVKKIGAKPAGQGHISKDVVKVFRVNYGYRALMDWSQVGSGKSALRNRGASDLIGPKYFTKANRPPERQGSRRKILGQEGLYYDVPGPNRTPLFRYNSGDKDGPTGGMVGTKANTGIDRAVAQLAGNPQQWIYLAAESMYGKANPPPINWTNFALTLGEELGLDEHGGPTSNMVDSPSWHQGRQLLAESMGLTPAENVAVSPEERAGRKLGFSTSSVKSVSAHQKWRPNMSYSDEEAELLAGEKTAKSSVSASVLQKSGHSFNKLLTGVGTLGPDAWLGAFVSKARRQGMSRVTELQAIFEKYFKRYRYDGTGLDKGDMIEITEGPKTVEEFAATSDEGTTVPEQVDVSPDIIRNPSFRNYGNPVDLKFEEEIKVRRGPTFKRMDTTSSFFIDPKTGEGAEQHGTGKAKYNFDNIKTKLGTERLIEKKQWENLQQLNKIIDKFSEFVKIINKERRKTGEKPIRVYKGGKGVADLQSIRAELGAKSKSYIYKSVKGATAAEISWALHHMANMVSGAGETYASNMSILVNGRHSTLVLVYETDATTGKYTKVHANIFEDETPLEWTIRVAQELGAAGILDEIAQNANTSIAALGLAGVTQFGVGYQAAEWAAGSVVHPRMMMGKLIPPQLGARLDEILSNVYKHMAKNVQMSVKDQIKRNAVTYSKQARKFGQGHNIHLWHTFAVKYLMGAQQQMYKDVAGGDPFWFLWMAPYVSTEIHVEGGAVQIEGGKAHSGMGAASPAGMPSY